MNDNLGIILQRLNKIDTTLDAITDNTKRVDIFIARSEEREKQTSDVIKRFGDRLDKHDERLQKMQDQIQENAPLMGGVSKFVHGIVGALAASLVLFFTRGDK